jgi:nicotinamidase/pyrazinamidase
MDETSHKALLIVDMLKDFIEVGSPMEVPAGRWIIENIAGEIRYAREKRRPIIYLCDRHAQDDPEFECFPRHAVRGTPGAECIDALCPQPNDHVVEMSGYSGFYQSQLDKILDDLAVDEVLICGVLTNVGILYTAMDALQRGIRVIVPETCVAALTEEDHRFGLRQISQILKPISRG